MTTVTCKFTYHNCCWLNWNRWPWAWPAWGGFVCQRLSLRWLVSWRVCYSSWLNSTRRLLESPFLVCLLLQGHFSTGQYFASLNKTTTKLSVSGWLVNSQILQTDLWNISRSAFVGKILDQDRPSPKSTPIKLCTRVSDATWVLNLPSRKEMDFPTIIFQVGVVKLHGCIWSLRPSAIQLRRIQPSTSFVGGSIASPRWTWIWK